MKCRICGNAELSVMTNKIRRGNGTVYYCSKCDYGMLAPKFNDAEKYYDKEYREKFKDAIDENGREAPKDIFRMRKDYQNNRLNIISKYYDDKKSFMEIGSSAGQFLYYVIDKFKCVAGIELDTACAKYCKQLLRNLGGGIAGRLHSRYKGYRVGREISI